MRALQQLLDWCLPPRPSAALVRDAVPARLEAAAQPHWAEDTSLPVLALFPYRDALVQACIVEGKFHANARAHAALGGFLGTWAEASADEWLLAPRPVRLVPVPLSAARLAARGYNQAERYAAYAVAGAPWCALEADLLVRARDTSPQTELGGDARRRNMRDAFAATRTAEPHHTYIVLDDVTTTGATLEADVHALRAAGARHIRPLALAH